MELCSLPMEQADLIKMQKPGSNLNLQDLPSSGADVGTRRACLWPQLLATVSLDIVSSFAHGPLLHNPVHPP